MTGQSMDVRTRERLAKVIPLLASNHEGEAIAAARSIVRVLDASGLTLHDLAESTLDGGAPAPVTFRWPHEARRSQPPPPPPPKPEKKPMPEGPVTAEEVIEFALKMFVGRKTPDRDRHFVSMLSGQARDKRFRFDPTPAQAERWRTLLEKSGLVIKPKRRKAA